MRYRPSSQTPSPGPHTIETRTTATWFFSAATSPAFNKILYSESVQFKRFFQHNLSSEQTGEVRRREVAWPSVSGTFQQRMSKAPLHIGRDLSKSENCKDIFFKGLLNRSSISYHYKHYLIYILSLHTRSFHYVHLLIVLIN